MCLYLRRAWLLRDGGAEYTPCACDANAPCLAATHVCSKSVDGNNV